MNQIIFTHSKKIISLIWLVVIVGAVLYYFKNGISIIDIQRHIQSFGIYSGIIFIVVYTIRPLIFFPTSIMTPLSAVLFGPWLGWLYAYVGETLSATVAFFVARYLGRSFVQEKLSGFLRKYDEQLTCCGFETVLFLRLVPLFPFDFVNYASGLSGVRYQSYIGATLLGTIPGLTAYIFLGGSLTEPILVIPTIILFLVISFTAHHYHKKNTKTQDMHIKNKEL